MLGGDGEAPSALIARTPAQAERLSRLVRSQDRARVAAVNFSSRTIVGVVRGFPTCGYGVALLRVERAGATLRLVYTVHAPPPDVMVCDALTRGYELVTVPRTAVAGVTAVRAVRAA
jgi:hypothetical protein